jgi:signal peptidase complex subunit 2
VTGAHKATMSTQEKISVYNLAGKSPFQAPLPPNPELCRQGHLTQRSTTDLKNTSDDAIPNYLNSLKIKQSHTLTDVRLALGYGAFALAAVCFLWDHKLGFDATKYYTAAAVAVYTLLNGALTGWIMFVEKGIVYTGTAPSGETVSQA